MSDFANAIVQGNLAGEIVTIFPHQVLYKDIENYLNKKRWVRILLEINVCVIFNFKFTYIRK